MPNTTAHRAVNQYQMTSKASPIDYFHPNFVMSQNPVKSQPLSAADLVGIIKPRRNVRGSSAKPITYPRVFHTFAQIPAESAQPSDAESSQDSRSEDLGAATGLHSLEMSPSGRNWSAASPGKYQINEASGKLPANDSFNIAESMEYDLSAALKMTEAEKQSDETDFKSMFTDKYIEEKEFDFKELLRRERNRAAAHRSNIKKKLEKEARKRELDSLQRLERTLRMKELELRRQNKCLRSLVYMSGQRLPVIHLDKI